MITFFGNGCSEVHLAVLPAKDKGLVLEQATTQDSQKKALQDFLDLKAASPDWKAAMIQETKVKTKKEEEGFKAKW